MVKKVNFSEKDVDWGGANRSFNRLTRPMERQMEQRYGPNWREAYYGRQTNANTASKGNSNS